MRNSILIQIAERIEYLLAVVLDLFIRKLLLLL